MAEASMAHVSAFGMHGHADPASVYWSQPQWWGAASAPIYPQALTVQMVEAHLHQQQAFLEQAASLAWHGMPASEFGPAAVPTAAPMQPGNVQWPMPWKGDESVVCAGASASPGAYESHQPMANVEQPVDFALARMKILSARESLGKTEKPMDMQIRTAMVTEIDTNMENAPKTDKFSSSPPNVNKVSNSVALLGHPAAHETHDAGASSLRMVKDKDAASLYLMQQLKIAPLQNESWAPTCAHGAALLQQLQTPKHSSMLQATQNTNMKAGAFDSQARKKKSSTCKPESVFAPAVARIFRAAASETAGRKKFVGRGRRQK